jgi:transcriptional regulator with XRE-family HTH domain
MRDDTSYNLATNIRQLREARGLSQQHMAKLTGIPRPTWTNLESGSANPTLTVLVRVAAALQLRVEELIAPPKASARFYRAHELPQRQRGQVSVRKLLPDPLSGFEIERMELPVGASMTGTPHTPGTREYLTCESGSVQLQAAGETWLLGPGELVVFRGDQRHSYKNAGSELAIAYSVVAFSPV